MQLRYLPPLVALALLARVGSAQSVIEHIALGDRAHTEMQPAEALTHYEAAIKEDSTNYEALWKASRDAIDIAEFETDKGKREQLFADGERFGRMAVAVNPNDAEGHFSLARALGKLALTKGVKERIKFAKNVRNEALAALKINPDHPGANHVMGRWNAEIMRLNGFSRFMAQSFLGGDVFRTASWDDAVKYMEKSVAEDPGRLTHHLDLGEIYLDVHQPDKARAQLEMVVNGEATDFNDKFYKRVAEQKLKEIK
jgi:tetratricopeptide (TPR) repeat protein